jgi:AcrR family transcriptional regulator
MEDVKRRASEATRERLTRAERRARILDAATQAFAAEGYDRASIEEIAELAGITKPVIYHHFESKRDLYISVLELYRGELLAFMGKRAINAPSPGGRLASGIDAFLEFVETHPRAWRILFQQPPPSDEAIVDAHRRAQERARAGIVTLMAAAPTAEHPNDPTGDELVTEREMAAEVIKAAADGLAAWWYAHRDVPREHLLYVLMNVLWIGFDRFVAGERWADEQSDDGD